MEEWETYVGTLPGTTRRGGEVYLTIDSALAALGWIEDQGVTLLGIEGFHLTADATRPSLKHIAHLAAENGRGSGPDPVREATVLLDRWRHEVDAVVLVIDSE